ncbi:MAG: MBL fold metallo-hydrolase [candidate division Zixibacteria bacterium]|nr:MBL fold metallo-hydrolase [candidate division Zixibacteria bacterium]
MITLSFHGAAGTVTGSKYLVNCNGQRILIDCGMFQGAKELRERNWNPLPFDPRTVFTVVLTHAHIDHVGYLPRLVRLGFDGNVFATPPTCDIAAITLADSAGLQEEDAAFRNKRKATSHPVALPLFTAADAETAIDRFQAVTFGEWKKINECFRFRYHIVGHLLGAASVELEITDSNRRVTILFSGDVGRYAGPLTIDPANPPACDYLVCESTYGGRMHEPEDPYFALAALLDDVIAKRSVLLIPAFAIGRTQQIMYMMNRLEADGRISRIPVHIDSPMAIHATDLYVKYAGYHKLSEDRDELDAALDGRDVTLHRKRESSKDLNSLRGPAVIISASGMLTGGRILHHLINRLPDPKTIVAIVGFLPAGTLGHRLLDGDKLVYIHKQPVDVRAKIVKLSGLSGHADYYEILHWLEPMTTRPKKVFVTHGEPEQSAALAEHFRSSRGWDCRIPRLDDSVEL